MIHRRLPLFLLIVTLLPVPVLYFLGERGLGSLEAADLRLRGEQARESFLKDLRQELPSLVGEPELPLNEPDRIVVLENPSGEFLVSPPLLRARALLEEGRIAEALDAISPALRGRVDLNERAAAFVLATDLLIEAGYPERAEHFMIRAHSITSEEGLRPLMGRWIDLRALLMADRAIDVRIAEWCGELRGRPTSLEELVLIRELLRSVETKESSARFLAERLRWPEWCAEFQRSLRTLGVSGRCLARTRSGWFVSDQRQQSFRRVDRLEQWVADWNDGAGASAWLGGNGRDPEAGQASLNGVVATGNLSIDWGVAGVQFGLPASALFGAFDPRLLLWAGLALYALLSMTLVAAVSRQQRRSDQLVVARGDLIAQVTHELRTPLTVLRMYGETLLSERVTGVARREYLETIVSESERLGALVDRIAAVAREEPRDKSLHESVRAHDLEPVIRQVVRQYHAVVGTSRGRVQLEPVEEQAAPVQIDLDDFRLILEVLVDNAVRYGGVPPDVLVRCFFSGGRLNVDVCDRGEGLSMQERETVFERWVRGRAGRRSGSRGAGMGLHLARKLARRHGGDVTLEAGPEQGLRARLWLPLFREGESECSAS